MTSYMNNISLFMSKLFQQFRTNSSNIICFCIYCSDIIKKKLVRDEKRNIFHNMTSLAMLSRDFIAIKFHYKGKIKKTVTS